MRSFILLLSTVVHFLPTLATWSYPECAWSIMSNRMPASCASLPQGTFAYDQARNRCLCSDAGFIFDVARTIYTQCSCDVLQQTAQTFVYNCNGTDTPSVKNETEIFSEGSSGKTTCDGQPVPPGLSLAEKIGIGVAVGVGFWPTLAGFIQVLIWCHIVDEKRSPWPFIGRHFCCFFRRAARQIQHDAANDPAHGNGQDQNQNHDHQHPAMPLPRLYPRKTSDSSSETHFGEV